MVIHGSAMVVHRTSWCPTWFVIILLMHKSDDCYPLIRIWQNLRKKLDNSYQVFISIKKQQQQLSWQNVGCLQNEDRRPKNEDPNSFARIRHGQLKNQAKAFVSASTFWDVYKTKAEDRRPKTKDRRPKTEDRRPKTEDRRPKTEDRKTKTLIFLPE